MLYTPLQAFMHVAGDGAKAVIDTSKFVQLPLGGGEQGGDGKNQPRFK